MDDEMRRQFLRLYTREFPLREQARLLSCTVVNDGWESDLFALKLEYKQDALHAFEHVMLKVYHGERAAEKARNEFQALRQLASAGFPVPTGLFAVLDASPVGRACVAMEQIQGRTMLEIFLTSPLPEQLELLTRFCQLFVDLHHLDWRPLAVDLAQEEMPEFIPSLLSAARSYMGRHMPQVFDPVFDWLQARNVTCQRFSVIHRDYHPGNVIVRDDGRAFVIDWTGMGVSDYRFDLGWTLLLLNTYGYAEAGKFVLEEYQHLAGQPVAHLDFFEVYACARRLFDITVSLSDGATSMSMKPEAALVMRQNAAHIRAVYAQLQQRTGCSLPAIERVLVAL